MLILYDSPLSLNCYKVRLLLALLGVAYHRQRVDLRKGEHRTEQFLVVNPFGQIPMLEHGEFRIRDSQTILIWLARRFADEGWLPRDPDQEAEVNGWLAAAAFELRLGPYDARLAKHFPSLCVNADQAVENSHKALQLYERRLEGRQWLALEQPTISDVAAFPAIAHCSDGGIDLAPYPAIRRWLDRMKALPGFVSLLD